MPTLSPSPQLKTLKSATLCRQGLTLLGLGALLLPLPGCQTINSAASVTQLRVVDASPNAPLLDIYQGGSILAYGLSFGTQTTYVPLIPGTYGIVIAQNKTNTQLATQQGTFLPNGDYTVLVSNYASSLQEVILKDQSTGAPAGSISVRFLDESTAAGAVDLYLVPGGVSITTLHPVVTGLSFNGNSGYVNVPNGTFTLVAVPAGTLPTTASVSLISGSAATTYASGAARTFVLIDNLVTTSPTLQVLSLTDYDSPSAN